MARLWNSRTWTRFALFLTSSKACCSRFLPKSRLWARRTSWVSSNMWLNTTCLNLTKYYYLQLNPYPFRNTRVITTMTCISTRSCTTQCWTTSQVSSRPAWTPWRTPPRTRRKSSTNSPLSTTTPGRVRSLRSCARSSQAQMHSNDKYNNKLLDLLSPIS